MELEIIKAVQSIESDFLTALMECITFFGEPLIIVFMFSFIYWCVDSKNGRLTAFALLCSICVNGAIKDIFKMPRPIGQPGIKSYRVHTATGFSFPSGHTQSISSMCFSAAMCLKKRFLWVCGTILTILVGVSRVYLGVHYPKDVLIGAVLGIIIPFIIVKLDKKIKNSSFLYIGACLFFLPFLLFLNVSEDFIKAFALLCGFAVSFFLEKSLFTFIQPKDRGARVLSFVLGVAMLGALASVLKLIMPDSFIFTFIRYMLISAVGLGVFPYLSVKLSEALIKHRRKA